MSRGTKEKKGKKFWNYGENQATRILKGKKGRVIKRVRRETKRFRLNYLCHVAKMKGPTLSKVAR